jgi:hypothetical protein
MGVNPNRIGDAVRLRLAATMGRAGTMMARRDSPEPYYAPWLEGARRGPPLGPPQLGQVRPARPCLTGSDRINHDNDATIKRLSIRCVRRHWVDVSVACGLHPGGRDSVSGQPCFNCSGP